MIFSFSFSFFLGVVYWVGGDVLPHLHVDLSQVNSSPYEAVVIHVTLILFLSDYVSKVFPFSINLIYPLFHMTGRLKVSFWFLKL